MEVIEIKSNHALLVGSAEKSMKMYKKDDDLYDEEFN